MRVRPAVYIVEKNKVLTMKYIYGGKEVYNLPGGNLEFGEELKEALVRELLEELEVRVLIGEMIAMGEVHLNGKVKLHVIFNGRIQAGVPTLNPNETTALEVAWVPLEQLNSVNLYPNVASHLSKQEEQSLYLGTLPQKWF